MIGTSKEHPIVAISGSEADESALVGTFNGQEFAIERIWHSIDTKFLMFNLQWESEPSISQLNQYCIKHFHVPHPGTNRSGKQC